MKTYSILMLGAKGVGKTTLLTLICDELKKELEQFGVNLEMDAKTKDFFVTKKDKIYSMLEGTFDITNRLEGTDQYESYDLDLKDIRGQQAFIRLHFQDCPGGDLTDPHKQNSHLMKHFLQADTIIYVLDTPYLMENGGEYNEIANHMGTVYQLFTDHIKKLRFQKLFIVPLKCERYDSDKVRRMADLLLEKLQKELELHGKQVDILPVHTIGTILFERFLYDGGERPGAKYIRKYPNSKLQPQNIDVLTRKLLYAIPTETKQGISLARFLGSKADSQIQSLKEQIKGMI